MLVITPTNIIFVFTYKLKQTFTVTQENAASVLAYYTKLHNLLGEMQYILPTLDAHVSVVRATLEEVE
ncbi:hypothetical protein Hanom_Chr17g01532601 [Helianthus anomalus]